MWGRASFRLPATGSGEIQRAEACTVAVLAHCLPAASSVQGTMALRTGEEPISPATCSEGSWPLALSPLGEAAVGSAQGGLEGFWVGSWLQLMLAPGGLPTTNAGIRRSLTFPLGSGTGAGGKGQMKAGQAETSTSPLGTRLTSGDSVRPTILPQGSLRWCARRSPPPF